MAYLSRPRSDRPSTAQPTLHCLGQSGALLVAVEPHGVQTVGIEIDLAGSTHSAGHLDLLPSELAPGSAGSELTNDQIEGVATGKQRVDEMIAENSSAPLAEVWYSVIPHFLHDTIDVEEKPRARSALETRTWEHYIKTLQDFNNWSSELFTLGMTPDEKAALFKREMLQSPS
ncbi:hypothetical protein PCANC_17280 [Puccinia coronata f. sp. avenae]|uniref:Uncharacterized protein n=1 Tax=Puccinia coronata f. sp. avenae TaxID=200324 RepID=A0A2N5UIB7_9BASI|nr:hypothetical protein PCANC_17280 [Puccinia coronata f. sp. avenae]